MKFWNLFLCLCNEKKKNGVIENNTVPLDSCGLDGLILWALARLFVDLVAYCTVVNWLTFGFPVTILSNADLSRNKCNAIAKCESNGMDLPVNKLKTWTTNWK